MKYKVNSELKSLSANLKRLDMGFCFSTNDFSLLLEEYRLDEFWEHADHLRRAEENVIILSPEIDYSKYSNNFIVGLDIILLKYYNNKIDFEVAKKLFTNFFYLCFKYYIEKIHTVKDYSKLIEILEQNDFMDKKVLSEILVLISQREEFLKATEIETAKTEILEYPKNIFLSEKKYQIFISSTFTDLIEERQAAVEAILKKGHIPAGMELFTAGDKSQWDVIKRWIDDSDIYLLILGGRYGSIDKSTGLSYTEMEYNYALEKGKPLFALSLTDDILDKKDIKTIKDYDLKDSKYIDFKEKVKSKMCAFPKNIDQIKTEINHSLDTLITENRHKMQGWIKGNL
jgi:hypothetical protein